MCDVMFLENTFITMVKSINVCKSHIKIHSIMQLCAVLEAQHNKHTVIKRVWCFF